MSENDEGILTIAYIECMIRGEGWQSKTVMADSVWRSHKVWREDGNELWIVRPDGLRRAWTFRLGSTVEVSPQAVQFKSKDVITELAVDEDEQQGKPPRPKLPPKNSNTNPRK